MHQVFRRLGVISAELWCEPAFRLGLLLKLVLIAVFAPQVQTVWFIEFIRAAVLNLSYSPWGSWLSAGGDASAFPYGPAMLLAHLPPVVLGIGLDELFGLDYFAGVGFRLSLLLADIGILVALLRLFPDHTRKLVIYYWLSPLVIFITYWHGQTDLIPVFFLVASLWMIQRNRFTQAGIGLGLSISAKFSMGIALPLMLLFFWQNKSLRTALKPFTTAFLACLVLFQGPFLLSQGFQQMVLHNREVARLYQIAIDYGDGLHAYVAPLAYLFVLYLVWRLRRINVEMLWALMGTSFSIIIVLTPAPPGWFLWLVPFYVGHQLKTGYRSDLVVGLLSMLFVVYHGVFSWGAAVLPAGLAPPSTDWGQDILSERAVSLLYTFLIAAVVLMAVQVFREGVVGNDRFQLRRRPLAFAAAGNSGTGKKAFASSMGDLFGSDYVVHVSGDDYLNWDNNSPMWNTATPLNPKANQLARFADDIRRLMNGEEVQSRRFDRASGRFTPLHTHQSEGVIIASGILALYPQSLRNLLAVKFFLDLDENLRSMVDRETTSASPTQRAGEQRQQDYAQFVEPQREFADVVFTLTVVNPELMDSQSGHLSEHNLRLIVRLRNGIYYRELVRALVGVCGMLMNVTLINDQGEVELEVQGDVSAEDIALAAQMLVPRISDLLDTQPMWKSGMAGVMQLVALVEIHEALQMRGLLSSTTR